MSETVNLKRDFANITDATSMILVALGFRSRRLRDFICGLQGVAGARFEFDCTHLELARRLDHNGKQETAETFVSRYLNAMEREQQRTGKLVFGIVRGGGIECRPTHYVDHITSVAVGVVQQARESQLWNESHSRAIAAFVPEAVEKLPPAEGVSEDMSANSYTTPDEVRIARNRKHAITRACANFTIISDKQGDVIAHAESLAAEILERARLIAQKSAIGGTNLYPQLAERPVKNDLLASKTRIAYTNGSEPVVDRDPPQKCRGSVENPSKNESVYSDVSEEGVQICTPSDSKEDTGRVTNLLPRNAEEAEKAEEKPDMLAAALSNAGAGKPVFPTRADKTPHTANGFKDATTDEHTIRAWWRRWPDAGIGIPTGKASGLLVLDIDPPHGGYASLCDLLGEHNALPETMEVRTGGGGIHYAFDYPQDIEIRNSAGKLGEGIDVRGEGGYIIAPPSLHASGRRYERLNDAAPAPVPEWLLKLLTEEKRKVRAAPAAQTPAQAKSGAATGDVIAEGSRNEMLFKIGSSLRGKGAEYEEVESQLLEANARRCTPALPVDEVIKIARSVMRYAPNCATVGA